MLIMHLKQDCLHIVSSVRQCAWCSHTFEHFWKYLQNFQKCLKVFSKLQMIFSTLQKSSQLFANLRRSLEGLRWLWEMFGWYLLTFRRVQVILGSAQRAANCLCLSLEGLWWTLTTFEKRRMSIGSLRVSLY